MIEARVKHVPTDACANYHRYGHDVDEDPDTVFLACGECFHVFPTGRALWRDHMRVVGELTRAEWRTVRRPPTFTSPQPAAFDWATRGLNLPPSPRVTRWSIVRNWLGHALTRPSKIRVCPHCTHDL